MAETKKVHFIIERQDTPDSAPYTEEFLLDYRPAMNVVSSLMEIQKNPVNKACLLYTSDAADEL